jgi:hypothetical protein
MPELEACLQFVDLRELLSEDISARDRCQKIAKEQLLSHITTALAAWRGKPPDPSIFAMSADRLVCAQCYDVNVADPKARGFITLHVQGCNIVAAPMHAPSRTSLLLPLLLSHNLPLPRVH